MTAPQDELTRIAWHVMEPEQRRAWAEKVRQDAHMSRYTVDELIEYRNKQHTRDQVSREVSDIEDEIATLKDRLCDAEAQLEQADLELRDYQREIESAALDRQVLAAGEVQP